MSFRKRVYEGDIVIVIVIVIIAHFCCAEARPYPNAQQMDRGHPERYERLPHSLPRSGKFLLIYVCNFHVLSDLLLIYICKLHWNLVMNVFHLLCRGQPAVIDSMVFRQLIQQLQGNFLLIYICKLHWNLNTMFVCQVNYF